MYTYFLLTYLCKYSIHRLLNSYQALLEAMGANGSTGPEAAATAEKNAAILTAKAGARDPSAIPSICRVSAALQYPAGELSTRINMPEVQCLFAMDRFWSWKMRF